MSESVLRWITVISDKAYPGPIYLECVLEFCFLFYFKMYCLFKKKKKKFKIQNAIGQSLDNGSTWIAKDRFSFEM